MTVLITLTTAGADSGPFDLYTNLDGYVSAFATGVSKSALLAGYSSSAVPDFATIIRVKSTGDCVNYIDIVLTSPTTTTTTTTLPISEEVLLGYSGVDSATACTNIATPVTKYIPYGEDWLVVTYLYENASPDITPAISGYYSDGAKWYYWDETTETFTSTGFC
jgi:hypothetical protein